MYSQVLQLLWKMLDLQYQQNLFFFFVKLLLFCLDFSVNNPKFKKKKKKKKNINKKY